MKNALAGLVLSLSTAPLSRPALASVSPGAPEAHQVVDAQSASLRRTLMSVVLLKKLNLTAEQKASVQAILTEAKARRQQAGADPALGEARSQRQALLQKAIEEARATGSVSPETKSALESLRQGQKERFSAFREEAKTLKEKLQAVLTPEQVESLRSLKADREASRAATSSPEMSNRSGYRSHRGGLLRLVLSDEFAAELAR